MRIAALYDIHGNLPALEAVLREVETESVDRLIVGGDALLGPMPRETLECLRGLDVPIAYIRGNTEHTVLRQMDDLTKGREKIRWVAQQLHPDYEGEIRSWPATVSVQVSELGEVLFCHATPRSDTEVFTSRTSSDRLLPLFEELNVPLVVCGHTHMQFDRVIGDVRVVNAGSVGMSFEGPGAYWLLLGPDIELRRTSYDLTGAAERIRCTEYPEAQPFAANNVLETPSKAEMLEVFARSEVG